MKEHRNNIIEVIDNINIFLKDFLWMFWEVTSFNQTYLTINGTLDEHWVKYLCKIHFYLPHSVMLPVEWQSEKNPFIRLSNVSETIKMNNAFDVLNSNYIFALQQNNIRDNNSFVYVAAENITFEILK